MIYADYNATTPMDPRVVEAVSSSFQSVYGNPSSVQHLIGRQAAEVVELARLSVAGVVAANPRRVVFTSGATEAINLAMHGVMYQNSVKTNDRQKHQIMVAATEHKAVIEAARHWGNVFGIEFIEIPVNGYGHISLQEFENLLNDETLLIAVALANNETGNLHPISELARIAKDRGAIFLTDATQGLGKVEIDIKSLNCDFLAFSAHKAYGPKGVGALIGATAEIDYLQALQGGGGQENGIRGGTLNVSGIVGFGEACRLISEQLVADMERARQIRDDFVVRIKSLIPDLQINGDLDHGLPNTVNLRFPDTDAEAVMTAMPDVAISTGSACQSAVPTPSHVLISMGLSHEEARECLRFSFGRFSELADNPVLVSKLVSAIKHVRSFN